MAFTPIGSSRFSIEGLRIRRINPDGTNPTTSYTVGGIGPFDYSGEADTTQIPFTVKIDSTEETQNIDLSTGVGSVSEAAVTVDEIVTALTTAAYANMTFSKDGTTNRLKAVAGTGSYLQLYGAGFKIALVGQGYGTQFIKCFDNTVSLGRPKNIKDFEEIETESGDGTLRTVIVDAVLKGENPVLTFNDDDYQLKEVIQGGTYNATTYVYEYPNSDQTSLPMFEIEAFVAKYAAGTNQRSDMTGYKKIYFRNCVGLEGDLTDEAKAWGQSVFNLRCTENYDDSGTKQSAVQESELTVTEFDALAVTTT